MSAEVRWFGGQRGTWLGVRDGGSYVAYSVEALKVCMGDDTTSRLVAEADKAAVSGEWVDVGKVRQKEISS